MAVQILEAWRLTTSDVKILAANIIFKSDNCKKLRAERDVEVVEGKLK